MSIKQFYVFCVFFAIVILAIGCTEKPAPILFPNINYKIKTLEKISGGEADSANGFSVIRIAYPEIQSADRDTVKTLINQYIYCFLLDQFGDSLCEHSLEYHMDNFVKDYLDFRSYAPESKQIWEERLTIAVLTDTLGIFSIGLTSYSYTGGAHPNSAMYFANFNSFTGDYIRLEDILIEGYRDRLNQIAERIFRKQKKLAPDADLEKAGYWFDDNSFSINDNFLITKGGILFYFNNYEIASYADGPTKILIPYTEIKALMKNKGPLAIYCRAIEEQE